MLRLFANTGMPLFRQVSGTVRELILSGKLAAGARLPSTRALARELSVSRSTVLLAFEELLAEGYVVGVPGSGTFVADLPSIEARRPASPAAPAPHAAQPRPRLSRFARRLQAGAGEDAARERGRLQPATPAFRYDFRYGLPGLAHFPLRTWSRIQGRRARGSGGLDLGYARTQGAPGLRISIARYLFRARGIDCDPEQILITTGSQQALDLAARVLVDPGDRVVIEDPHYLGAREILAAAGAELVPVPVDQQGMRVPDLAALRRADSAKLAYVTPSHQFPIGSTLSLPRRVELLAWARRCNAFILEDDYDSEFRYGQQPIEAIQSIDRDGRVIYVGTFSKVLFPALRLGYLVLPRPLVEPFMAAKWVADRHTAPFQQDVLDDFISGGHFERHLRRSRARYAALRETLLASLAAEFGSRAELSGTNSGLQVLVWLDGFPPERLPALVVHAASQGVGLSPAAPYFLAPPPRAGLVLGYAHMSASDIRAGIGALARSVARCAARPAHG